jgi:aminotransferase
MASGKRAIDQNYTSYTTNAGLLEVRKAAADFLLKKYELAYNPEHEVLVTSGASQALDVALRTILSEGNEVILPGPVYPGYEPIIRMCGSTPVYVDTTQNSFRLNGQLLAEKISEKTRCVIIPSANPTGCTLDEADLQSIAEVLKDKKIFIISDEIYSELMFENRHRSIAAIPSVREKTIVINGLSKSHSMTGWRIGLTFAPAYITKQMLKVHQYSTTCATRISQHAAFEALTAGIDDADAMVNEYRKRRDYVVDRLISMGFEVDKPKGAFYVFPSIKPFAAKSFDFAVELLEKAQVAVVPGTAFTKYGEGYVRISFACSMEVLAEGLNRIEAFLLQKK